MRRPTRGEILEPGSKIFICGKDIVRDGGYENGEVVVRPWITRVVDDHFNLRSLFTKVTIQRVHIWAENYSAEDGYKTYKKRFSWGKTIKNTF